MTDSIDALDLRRKRSLLTGGEGFLGTWVARRLVSRGVPLENIFIPRSRQLDLRRQENCLTATPERR